MLFRSHTHYPCLVHTEGLTILNPGSLSLPRQDGHKPSYILMELDREGEAHYHICYLGMKQERRFLFGNW